MKINFHHHRENHNEVNTYLVIGYETFAAFRIITTRIFWFVTLYWISVKIVVVVALDSRFWMLHVSGLKLINWLFNLARSRDCELIIREMLTL